MADEKEKVADYVGLIAKSGKCGAIVKKGRGGVLRNGTFLKILLGYHKNSSSTERVNCGKIGRMEFPITFYTALFIPKILPMLIRFKVISVLILIAMIVSSTWFLYSRTVEAAPLQQEVQSATNNELTPLTGVKQIAAGYDHTCALLTTGGVKCWGSGSYGQLGNGTTIDKNIPTDVSGLSSGVVAVTAGYNHTCAVMNTGGVKCWGYNRYGQLGDGTTSNKSTPTDASGLSSGVLAVAAGYNYTCAVISTGGVKCWGDNYIGQLGDGTTVAKNTPTDVSSLSSSVVAVAAGHYHTCALMSAGSVKCWGSNGSGRLGNETTDFTTVPVDVINLESNITSISVGAVHSCALTLTGKLKCWGSNGYGQLGNGNTDDSITPVETEVLAHEVVAVTAGRLHTCAILRVGGVKCWGQSFIGQTGTGIWHKQLIPADVAGLGGSSRAIDAGADHTCVVTTIGGAKCWGSNYYGQLGDGLGGELLSTKPEDVVGSGNDNVAIASGGNHSCTVTMSGQVKCWGSHSVYEVSSGTTNYVIQPVIVSGAEQSKAVSAGNSHTCVKNNLGVVKCWGANWLGELGTKTPLGYSSDPVNVYNLSSNVVKLSAGGLHTCAVLSSGALQCWGDNHYGQLGIGITDDRYTVRYGASFVNDLSSTVIDVSAGSTHTCVLLESHTVECWGTNGSGQLGDGTTEDKNKPVKVNGLYVQSVTLASGRRHTCVITNEGNVLCWGNNDYGQLGDGTIEGKLTPVNVTNLKDATALSAGSTHTCALTTSKIVKCWGGNFDGQLGDGTTMNRNMPIEVIGLDTPVREISAGAAHTCALFMSGNINCWGKNNSGQLGYKPPWSITPVDVMVELQSPNPTPTPQPITTPIPDQVVVFIPGIAGSRLVIPETNDVIWPRLNDFEDMSLNYNKANRPKVVTDDAIRWAFGVKDTYGSFIESLSKLGWLQEYLLEGDPNRLTTEGCDKGQQEATLFVFPWDWRYGVTDAVDDRLKLKPQNNVSLLRDYIQCIRTIHPNAEISVIAHSMGGLLARKYEMTYKEHHLKRVITVGTPWLGAPKAIAMLLTGDFIYVRHIGVQSLLEYFPGAHQLLPSKQYFELQDCDNLLGCSPLVDANNFGIHTPIPYTDFDKKLRGFYVSQDSNSNHPSSVTFVGNNEELFRDIDGKSLVDWRKEGSTSIPYFVIYGDEHEPKTIGQVTRLRKSLQFPAEFVTNIEMTHGDQTVPVLSSARVNQKGSNLNGKATVYRFTPALGSIVEHTALLQNTEVQNCIISILASATALCNSSLLSHASETQVAMPSRYLKLWGISHLQVSDGISTTENMMTNTFSLETTFPEIVFYYLGDDAAMLILPHGKTYTFIFTSTDYLLSESTLGVNENLQQVVRYTNMEVISGTRFLLTSADGNLAEIAKDSNADGSYETPIIPTSNLTGTLTQDSIPPTITFEYLANSQQVVIQAIDNESGVDGIAYSIDQNNLQPYTSPISVNRVQTTTIWAMAQDKRGNWSSVAEYVVMPHEIVDKNVYLPLIER